MKKLIVLILVAIGGLAVYNYATTGELSLTASFSKSEEERAVQELEDRFKAARNQLGQAHRGAAMAGIDTTADAEAAMKSVRRIRRGLESLRKTLSEDGAKREAAELASALQAFEKELR